MKPIINSVKHIVQRSLDLIQEQTISEVILAGTNATPTLSRHVVVGAVVKAIYLEYWLLGESSQPCTCTWTIEKRNGNMVAMTQAQGQDLDNYSNKRNILKMGQGVIGDSNSNPIPVLREWIKIPKGKQRFAEGDILVLNVSCIGEADNGLEICGFALYKEFQ